MKVAIMQPYIFPYIGYYQLIYATEKFIVYDDVTYIKQGWINRNNILVNNQAYLFTVPLLKPSSSKLIADTDINPSLFPAWCRKFLKSLEQSYGKAPFFDHVFPVIRKVLEAENKTITQLAHGSLAEVMKYLGIRTEWGLSSEAYKNQDLKGQARVLDICKQEGATQYINPIGGVDLYSREDFEREGIILNFIKSNQIEYKQFGKAFVPNLSIIDVLMFNSPQTIKLYLQEYALI